MPDHPLSKRALAYFDQLFPDNPEPIVKFDVVNGWQQKSNVVEFGNHGLDVPNNLHTRSNMLTTPSGTAIDLFCGCGGISEGLRLSGYRVLAGMDIERKYLASFKHNFREALAVSESILECRPQDLAQKLGLDRGELSILVGGPPCQGFSKNVPRKHRFLEDPKNQLVRSYLDYVEFFRPEIVLMENVAEMKNGFDGQYTDEVLQRLDRSGYSVTHAVLNAADYGVPQRRRRAFFMANRAGVKFSVPSATHSARREKSLFSFEESHVSVWEAIGDLPALVHGTKFEGSYPRAPQSIYQTRARAGSTLLMNHHARFLQPTQLARLAALEPGQGNKDLPDNLRVKGGYSGAYGRLTTDMIAPTITRWVFHPGSGRWGHPIDTRVLSIREVARIQGFPDTFEFVGSYLEQAGQLGNAVPPLLAATIIDDLRRQLQVHSAARTSRSWSKESFFEGVGSSKEIA